MKRKMSSLSCIFLSAALLLGNTYIPVYADTVPIRLTEKSHPCGYVPMSEDNNAPCLHADNMVTTLNTGLPSQYDTRDFIDIPEVRTQLSETCWAYAAAGLSEINMIKQGYAPKDVDYSELQIAYFTYHSAIDRFGGLFGDTNTILNPDKNCLSVGGSLSQAAIILTSWTGAIDESLAPMYRVSDSICGDDIIHGYQLPDSFAFQKDLAHVQGVYKGNILFDQDSVKQMIMNYGAVGVSFRVDSKYYDSLTNSYFFDHELSESEQVNHEVIVIGWDDEKETKAATPGAWLVRNSWAYAGSPTNSLETYFWLSYEDNSLANTAYSFEVEPIDRYQNNYQYDGTFFTKYLYLGSNSKVQIANIYTAASDSIMEELKAVSFQTDQTNLEYMVRIFLDPEDNDPTSGIPVCYTDGYTDLAGYYTIPLSESVTLEHGQRFSVVINLATQDETTVHFPVENTDSNEAFTSSCHVEEGQSFFRSFEISSWKDVTSQGGSYGNIRIKAFTCNVGEEIPPVDPINPTESEESEETRESKEIISESKAVNESKETQESRELGESQETRESKVLEESEEIQESKASNTESKAIEETSETKETNPETSESEERKESTAESNAITESTEESGESKETEEIIETESPKDPTTETKESRETQESNESISSDSHQILYHLNGGSNNSQNPTTYKEGQTIDLLAPTKVGFQFMGWYLEDTQEESFDPAQHYHSDLSLVAKWSELTYSITFQPGCDDVDVSDGMQSYSNIAQNKIVSLKNPYRRNGYTFSHWEDQFHNQYDQNQKLHAMLNGTQLEDPYHTATSLELTAVWRANTYNISYRVNGLSNDRYENPNAVTYSPNHEVVFEDLQVPAGYQFEGWYIKSSLDPSSILPSTNGKVQNLILFGNVTPRTYQVTFDPNPPTGKTAVFSSGSKRNEKVTSDAYVSQTMTYEKAANLYHPNYHIDGYRFLGWSLKPDGNVVYEDRQKVTTLFNENTYQKQITLYAQWTNGNTITYVNAQNGSLNIENINPDAFTPATNKTLALAPATRVGYDFTGWFQDPNCKTKLPINEAGYYELSIDKARDLNVYTKWTPHTFTVNFHDNSDNVISSTEMTSQSVTYGKRTLLNANTYQKEGYTFLGWNTNPNASEALLQDMDVISTFCSTDQSTVDLYAIWKANTYKISYIYGSQGKNGVIINDNPTVFQSDAIISLSDPVRPGYTFDGWYTDPNYENKIDHFIGAIYENTTLYAKWIRKSNS